MNERTWMPTTAAATDSVSAMLVVTDHYCLRDDPLRTLEALRVFLIRGAEPILDALLAQAHALVATGDRDELSEMAVAMHAQGFSVQLLPQALSLASSS